MALKIRLAAVLVAAALAAGCSQSLFDTSLGGDDPGRDGGTSDPDGGGRDSGGERDSAPERLDARAIDAADGTAPPDLGEDVAFIEIDEGAGEVVVMQADLWNGLGAWVARDPDSTDIRSAIVNCPANQASEYCAELPDGALLYVSTNDTHRPALRWTPPILRVLVDFQWVLSEGAFTTPPATVRVQLDEVAVRTSEISDRTQSGADLVPVNLDEGQVIQVLPAAGDPAGGHIGMRVNFLERTAPARSLR